MPGNEARLGDSPLADQLADLILGLPSDQLHEFLNSSVASGAMSPAKKDIILTAVSRPQAEGNPASEANEASGGQANEASASGGSMDPPIRRSDAIQIHRF